MALNAERPAALGHGVAAGAALAGGGCFEALAEDLRRVLRVAAERKAQPSAAILDSRTLRSSPESGTRAGYDGAKRKKGSKLHMAVDTLGHLLALHVTPASADDRTGQGRASLHRRERRPRLRRSRLHWRARRRGGKGARHRA